MGGVDERKNTWLVRDTRLVLCLRLVRWEAGSLGGTPPRAVGLWNTSCWRLSSPKTKYQPNCFLAFLPLLPPHCFFLLLCISQSEERKPFFLLHKVITPVYTYLIVILIKNYEQKKWFPLFLLNSSCFNYNVHLLLTELLTEYSSGFHIKVIALFK